MSAIRKIGSGTQWVKDAKYLKRRFTEIVKDENGSLDEAAKAELISSEAKIYGYAVPEEGRHYITGAAKTQLTEEKLKTAMIGDTEIAMKELWGLIGELKNDIMPAFNEIVNFSWTDFVKSWFSTDKDNKGEKDTKVENATITVNNGEINTFSNDVKSTAKKVVDDFEPDLSAFTVIRDYSDSVSVPVEPKEVLDKVTNKVKEVKDKAIEDKKEKLTTALEKLTAAINKNKDATANLNSYLSLNTTVTDNSGYFA